MTLPKLRELASKARSWRPPNNCREHPIVACGACAVCLGAQRAVEDIELCVENALLAVRDGRTSEEYVNSALSYSERAQSIAGYYGDPGDVEAFAAAVREMCNG